MEGAFLFLVGNISRSSKAADESIERPSRHDGLWYVRTLSRRAGGLLGLSRISLRLGFDFEGLVGFLSASMSSALIPFTAFFFDLALFFGFYCLKMSYRVGEISL